MHTEYDQLQEVLDSSSLYVVPPFQRYYKWKSKQWQELWDAVTEQYQAQAQGGSDPEEEGHFLGTLVLQERSGSGHKRKECMVVDGQQRLATISVLFAVIRDLRLKTEPDWSDSSFDTYLERNQRNKREQRLTLGVNDNDAFRKTVFEAKATGQVGEAYKWFTKKVSQFAQEEQFDFDNLIDAVSQRLHVNVLTATNKDNVNQIFNSINHAGMKLTSLDLIRNHTFMQFDSADGLRVYETYWRPMEVALGESDLEQYLWAQLVRSDAKALQKDLYMPYQRYLSQLAASNEVELPEATEDALKRFSEEVGNFEAILDPSGAKAKKLPVVIRDALVDLRAWGSTTYYPIALEVLSRNPKVHADQIGAALRHVLSFFVRRTIAGTSTNNLNRILSPLAKSLAKSHAVGDDLGNALAGMERQWPRDYELLQKGATTALYLTAQQGQVKFILGKLSHRLRAKEPVDLERATVEHFMPRSLPKHWIDYFKANDVAIEEALIRIHVLGNLTLSGYNSELATKLPGEKLKILKSSNIPLNRTFSSEQSWTPEAIDKRSEELLKMAIEIWPRAELDEPSSSDDTTDPTLNDDVLIAFSGLPELLEAIPANGYVDIGDLAALLVTSEDKLTTTLEVLKWPRYPFPKGEGHWVPGLREVVAEDFINLEPAAVSEIFNR